MAVRGVRIDKDKVIAERARAELQHVSPSMHSFSPWLQDLLSHMAWKEFGFQKTADNDGFLPSNLIPLRNGTKFFLEPANCGNAEVEWDDDQQGEMRNMLLSTINESDMRKSMKY
ncbi:hypothetical protein Tco_0065615 [Tanacetum coccineum]